MEDSIAGAIDFMDKEYDSSSDIKISRYAIGDLAGEWLVVDDKNERAFVILLGIDDSEEFDYVEVIEKYEHRLESVE